MRWVAAESAVLVNPPVSRIGAVNAILRGRAREYHVREFRAPLSIKTVPAGSALWETSEGRFLVDAAAYLILNDGRCYSMTIAGEQEVETFCVFFQSGFVGEVWRSSTTSAGHLLEDPDSPPASSPQFPETLRGPDPWVARRLEAMRRALDTGKASQGFLEESFHALASALLRVQGDIAREIARLPAVRASTRRELYRRLHRGRDFLHASWNERVTLSDAARAACLSPHHFLRLFRTAFGETPHRYLVRKRLERASRWLAGTERPVGAICLDCGFESFGSFSSLFRSRYGLSPREFRQAAGKKAISEKNSDPGDD